MDEDGTYCMLFDHSYFLNLLQRRKCCQRPALVLLIPKNRRQCKKPVNANLKKHVDWQSSKRNGSSRPLIKHSWLRSSWTSTHVHTAQPARQPASSRTARLHPLHVFFLLVSLQWVNFIQRATNGLGFSSVQEPHVWSCYTDNLRWLQCAQVFIHTRQCCIDAHPVSRTHSSLVINQRLDKFAAVRGDFEKRGMLRRTCLSHMLGTLGASILFRRCFESWLHSRTIYKWDWSQCVKQSGRKDGADEPTASFKEDPGDMDDSPMSVEAHVSLARTYCMPLYRKVVVCTGSSL